MLTTKCIHPGLMKALSLCGHGSKVLIADGNYPLAEKSGNAENASYTAVDVVGDY